MMKYVILYAIDNQIEKLNSLHLLNVIDSTSWVSWLCAIH